jgi:hypothetical protein
MAASASSGAVVSSWSLLIRWAQRARCQAETPLIVLFRFLRPALWKKPSKINTRGLLSVSCRKNCRICLPMRRVLHPTGEGEGGLQLHALAYNLGNFLRTLATPEPIKDWSLTSLKEKLIKIGAKVVSHGRYVVFQMAEVAIPRQMFQEILRLIAELRPQPLPAPA